MRIMPQPDKELFIPKPIRTSGEVRPNCPNPETDHVACERCGAAMFRMHAVWRCPKCRFKTDCCGW